MANSIAAPKGTAVADLGLIGLAVMGQNLVLNIQEKGFQTVVFNRTVSKVDEFLEGAGHGSGILGAHSFEEFFKMLKRPRRVLFMVKAGAPVDDLIAQCLPYLEAGDIIIDGGNSHYVDTKRRVQELADKGILFLGVGVSGGEEGARHGPSIMPGGNEAAWPHVKDIFQAIAAKADNGEPCCDWVGPDGAGHFVKMVHNGIEYGDMQLIAESYDLLNRGLQMPVQELAQVFSKWNEGPLKSYLIEITSKIFTKNDADGKPLVDKILDIAGQKGTGKWTSVCALELGMPLTLISEAVFARCLSALYAERQEAAKILGNSVLSIKGSKEQVISQVGDALYASKIMSYAQGFQLMREAEKEFGWKLNMGSIALMWRNGCIIRSVFLNKIKEAFEKNPHLTSLIISPYFSQELTNSLPSWRFVVSQGALSGIPIPCMSAALASFDGYRSSRLPTNLIQAQRDFFGAHTFERLDAPRGKFFHVEW